MRWFLVLALLQAGSSFAAEVHFPQVDERFQSKPLPARSDIEARNRSWHWKDEVLARVDLADPKGDPKAASSARMLQLGASVNPQGDVRRVLYPMARSDVARVFQVFSGPRGKPVEVWLVDSHPFGEPARVGQMFTSSEGKLNYYAGHHNADMSAEPEDQYDEQGRAPGVGPGLLWELERIGAQKISVQYLDDHGRALDAGALGRVTTMTPRGAWFERQAPIVRIRFQLDGQTREVNYVEHTIGRGALPPALRAFLEKGYDAFYEKAAGTPGVIHASELRAFRDQAMRGLRPGTGRVVTDNPKWEDEVKARKVPLGGAVRLGGGARTYSDDRSVWVFRRAPIVRGRTRR